MQNFKLLPLVPLRGLTVFPHMVLHFDAGRDKTVTALQESMLAGQECVLVSQKDARQTELDIDDIYEYGTIAKIKQILRLPGDSVRVLVEGIARAKVIRYTKTEPFFEVEAEIIGQKELIDDAMAQALSRELNKAFEKYSQNDNKASSESVINLVSQDDISKLTDIIAANVLFNTADKQKIIEIIDPVERAHELLSIMQKETEIKKLEGRIQAQVKKTIDKSQREYYLREQIKVIRKELNEDDALDVEAEAMLEQLLKLEITDEIREKAEKEIKRFATLPPGSHETPMTRTWLDWLFALPWGQYTKDDFDLKHARNVLDRDHYSLDAVKDRIIEQLAVCKLKDDTQGTILCLVGPPGVGKTSIATSVAKAVGRSFVRMSLGGVRDESEIRGHRRTYIGAIPGRIISAFKQAKTMNPIILLDEIDKMGADQRGDPAAAMLEVLDSAQNSTFRDHYMEIPFDLSKAMFIMTANTTSTIPGALLDRMEIITLSSYTLQEKVEIAKRHLVHKQALAHGIPKSAIKFAGTALNNMVEGYTREAGVRGLERKIAEACRKAATMIVNEEKEKVMISSKNLAKFLGPAKFRRDKLSATDQVGIATGLAWTSIGGETLIIEVTTLKGSGRMEITGQIGNVMRESASAAYTYVKANAVKLGINPMIFNGTDLHIHVPEGAIPKDGPSAGVSLATAIASAFNGIKVRGDVAMTGEITLRGRVLPIGGLKEKSIAAHREGIKTIIVPYENRYDIEVVPKQVLDELTLVYAHDIETVFKAALCEIPKPYMPKQETGEKTQGGTISVIPETAKGIGAMQA